MARGRAGNHTAAMLAMAAVLACGPSCSKRDEAPVLTPMPARPRPFPRAPPVAVSRPAPAPAPPPSSRTIAKVRKIVAHNLELPVAEVSGDAPLSALRKPADDLAVVEIVLALEEAFRIEISDQDLEDATGGAAPGDVSHISVRTLAEIIERVSRRGRSPRAP